MNQIIVVSITGYVILMSLLGFAMMGIDKQKARKKAWRIPERTLLLIALIGGGIGSFLGMNYFRHKTKHKRFVLFLPFTAALYAMLLFWINLII